MLSNEADRILKIAEIKNLDPPFNGVSGWLSMTELNLLDPEALRFEIINEVLFEDGSMFVDVLLVG